jgi:tetratricopeptide (TPR) repeat protein
LAVAELLSTLLSALVATNGPTGIVHMLEKKAGVVTVAAPNDPLEKDFLKLLAADDAAQAEVDQWIRENEQFKTEGAGVETAVLNVRIRKRFEPVKQAYEDFLRLHPGHSRARLAYGSFLNDIGEEDGAHAQWEKARETDPQNPASWNNLANYYGHNGPVTNAFKYYAKAIELNPRESTYYFNLATTVYLFRHDATNYYRLTLPQVFEKAMDLYRKALELDPENFVLATDYAQSYYGFDPALTGNPEHDRRMKQKHCDDALAAWQRAFKLAGDDLERQGVLLHYARLQINAGRFAEARTNLNAITNEGLNGTKNNLLKKLERQSKQAPTNAPAQSPN